MIKNEIMTVIRQREIAHNIFELTLHGSLVSEMNEPGQFVHLRVSDSYDTLLRRPISIASIRKEINEFTMIYRAEGKGTLELSKKTAGAQIDVLGPLGKGFPVEAAEKSKKAYLIGGGIGVPPLYELSKQLKTAGVQPVHILGFQSSDVVFYEEEFSKLGETYIVTVDGTKGEKGFVTDVLKNLSNDFSTYYSCGPMPMLKAVSEMLTDYEGYLSLEERMGCSIGACFACVCKTNLEISEKDYVKVCADGPVFRAGVVLL